MAMTSRVVPFLGKILNKIKCSFSLDGSCFLGKFSITVKPCKLFFMFICETESGSGIGSL